MSRWRWTRKISSMMRDLAMDDRMKGQAAGIFFLGYVLLQMAGGHLAGSWSARKLISLCLIFWGLCAVGCGLARTFYQFEAARFLLGVSESSVFPATVVLLAHWFPSAERARANAFWNLCQPLAVVASAPVTGWLLGRVWLANHADRWRAPCRLSGCRFGGFSSATIRARPAGFPPAEKSHLETTLRAEAARLGAARHPLPFWPRPVAAGNSGDGDHELPPQLGRLRLHDLFHRRIEGETLQRGAIWLPVRRAVCPDRGHHGAQLLAFGQNPRTARPRGAGLCPERDEPGPERADARHFWLSYGFLCLAIPGPFAALAPFWAIPTETMPRAVFGGRHWPGQRLGQCWRLCRARILSAGSRPTVTAWLCRSPRWAPACCSRRRWRFCCLDAAIGHASERSHWRKVQPGV